MKSYLNQKSLPRGYRNNNPGNLVISAATWIGKLPKTLNSDGSFEQFEAFPYGLRAMMLQLLTYITGKRKLDTIRKIINVYAPPSENDTLNYIRIVERATGIGADVVLTPTKELFSKLVPAIVRHENGASVPPVTLSDFEEAWQLLPLKKKLLLQKLQG